jgi:hypothetical protein
LEPAISAPLRLSKIFAVASDGIWFGGPALSSLHFCGTDGKYLDDCRLQAVRDDSLASPESPESADVGILGATFIHDVVCDPLSEEMAIIDANGKLLTPDPIWHTRRMAEHHSKLNSTSQPQPLGPVTVAEVVLQKLSGGFGMKLDKDAV